MAQLSDELLHGRGAGLPGRDDVLPGRVRVRPPRCGGPGARPGRRRRGRWSAPASAPIAGVGPAAPVSPAPPVAAAGRHSAGRAAATAAAGSAAVAVGLTVLGLAAARRRTGHPRRRRRPGAVGQHVRVRHRADARRLGRLAGAACSRRPAAAAARPVRDPGAGRCCWASPAWCCTPRSSRSCRRCNSYWLKIHVTAAATASGTVAGRRSCRPRCSWSGPATTPASAASRTRIGPRLPAADALERLTFRLHAFAFPIWTLRRHLRRDLGRGGVGPLLGLGPEGDVVVHLLGGLRRLPARPGHPERQAHHRDLVRRGRLGHHADQPVRDQLRRRRPALVRRRRVAHVIGNAVPRLRARLEREGRSAVRVGGETGRHGDARFPYHDLRSSSPRWSARASCTGSRRRSTRRWRSARSSPGRSGRSGPALLFENDPGRRCRWRSTSSAPTGGWRWRSASTTSTRSASGSAGWSSPSCRSGWSGHPGGLGKLMQLKSRAAEEGEARARARRSSTRATTWTWTGCPALLTWPDDGGIFHNFGLTHTKHPETGKRNLGLYRLQQHSPQHLGMHWQIHKDSTAHHAVAERLGRAAAGRDRLRLRPGRHLRRDRAAARRHRRVPVRRVPAGRAGRDGRLPDRAAAGAGARAGRAGGLAGAGRARCPRARSATTPASTRRSEPFPVLHVECMTTQRDPIYHSIVRRSRRRRTARSARPPSASSCRCSRCIVPDIVDYHLPEPGVFHNCADRLDRQAVPEARAEGDERDLGRAPDVADQADRGRRRRLRRARLPRGRLAGASATSTTPATCCSPRARSTTWTTPRTSSSGAARRASTRPASCPRRATTRRLAGDGGHVARRSWPQVDRRWKEYGL